MRCDKVYHFDGLSAAETKEMGKNGGCAVLDGFCGSVIVCLGGSRMAIETAVQTARVNQNVNRVFKHIPVYNVPKFFPYFCGVLVNQKAVF